MDGVAGRSYSPVSRSGARLDDEIQTQLGSVAGRANLDELSADNTLRSNVQPLQLREETEKLGELSSRSSNKPTTMQSG
ncbi:MAG: hypothetical protein U0894_18945 [Pirellulales bacterium]